LSIILKEKERYARILLTLKLIEEIQVRKLCVKVLKYVKKQILIFGESILVVNNTYILSGIIAFGRFTQQGSNLIDGGTHLI